MSQFYSFRRDSCKNFSLAEEVARSKWGNKMNSDHNSRITAKKKSIAGRVSSFWYKLPPVAMVKRFSRHRRAGFAFWPSFWMSHNKL